MDIYNQVLEIFSRIAAIPRSSHHEQGIADFLCAYANNLGLDYTRDANNNVVIRKPATPGYESAQPIVLLNHMDMVAVGDGARPFNPLTDGIETYIEDGWMKARGTSLGADNGIGLSMALAVLASNDIVHGPLEVLTTTNEEDGMTGAAGMSADFIHGRKVINLDSEDYDTITVGAAGACLQVATIPITPASVKDGLRFFEISVSGGKGGHSGVDIGKGRINAIHELSALLYSSASELYVSCIYGGSANASIAADCTSVVGVPDSLVSSFKANVLNGLRKLQHQFSDGDGLCLKIMETEKPGRIVADASLLKMIASLPCGVIRMHDSMPDTVMTSNNIGVVRTADTCITLSCHTRSFSDSEMVSTANGIHRILNDYGCTVEVLMNTPGWQEDSDSDFIQLTANTFHDVLGFMPHKVAMHFVLEAGYYVKKFPGIEIACIGPKIIEPHSPRERVELSTVRDLCQVLVELLNRLA